VLTETSPQISPPAAANTSFLWLEVTGKCPLECTHCYIGNTPLGSHIHTSAVRGIR
jgi:MoaA/NifB/PqqE/SkfB family radical SAM enzyme